jgi:hypothetical protein
MVAKVDKGSLRHPQKIFLFLLPENQKGKTKRVFFGLPLHLLPPTCDHMGIMFRCILRRRLAGWWLVAYIHRTVRIHFSFIGGSVPLISIQLLWLQFSIGRLPF